MNDEILKLAKSHSMGSDCKYFVPEEELSAFYRAAYNAGLERAADVVDNSDSPDCGGWNMCHIADAIRALKEEK